MSFSIISCTNCHRKYLKKNKYINENLKLSNNCYCSSKCQYTFKSNKKEFICENLKCNKKFNKQLSDVSPHNYCSVECRSNALTASKKEVIDRKQRSLLMIICMIRIYNMNAVFLIRKVNAQLIL